MKALSIFILAIFISYNSFSQESVFSGGVLAGLNGIAISGDKEEKWGAGGVTAGLFVNSKIATRFALQLEFRYVQKGSIHPYVNDYALQDWEVLRLHYIEMPLLADFALQKKSNFLYLQGGFAYAYLIDKSFSETRMQTISPGSDFDNYKNNDLSWVLGFGYAINKGALRNFSFQFRFSRSLISIHEYLKLYNVVYGDIMFYQIPFSKF